jgi:D-xylose transport system substrate-binding protein
MGIRPIGRAAAAVALAAGLPAAALSGLATASGAWAQEARICVSWRHFQEERWKIDEAGMRSVLDPAGAVYISADAQSDPQKQLADIEGLLTGGCNALIVLAQDSQAVLPAIAGAVAQAVPVIAYDAPIDSPDALFVSFDNVAVGRLMAEAMVAAQPTGNWALIEGDAAHPIVNIFRDGQMQVLQPLIDKGDIVVVAQQNTQNWNPDLAQQTVEQILTQQNNAVDAILAMNDGMSTGAAAALAAQALLGKVALSGQDGDRAVLNRIAKGEQTVTIWKNAAALGAAAAQAALDLAGGNPVAGTGTFTTASGAAQPALLLEPVAITRNNLDVVVEAGWIPKEELCAGVSANPPAACQ